MDETSIRLYQDAGPGLMTAAARKLQRSPRSLTRQVPRGVTRAMLTLATFVTDDPLAQAQLPQVLIVSSKLTSAAEVEAWRGMLPPHVVVWREARCWMTTQLMSRLLRLLSASLRHLLPERCVILSADAFRAHLARPAWVTAHRLGFYYHLIPARMTWALQPCDTHVFRDFKRRLAVEALGDAARAEGGLLTQRMLVAAVGRTIDSVLRSRSWTAAFRDTGLTGSQDQVSARTMSKLGATAPLDCGRDLPTLAMLRDIFPRRAIIPIEDVFGAFLPKPAGASAPASSVRRTGVRGAAAGCLPASPWRGRLRSSSALPESASAASETERPCRIAMARPRAISTPPTPTSATAAPGRRTVPVGHRLPLPPRLPPPRRESPPPAPPPAATTTSSARSSA